ncbi:uncharacterized protein [Henckelia pumila]|uniref:uncharacterized protein isoform X2 n=1 Tax=Henckelia pumila TaxID=405737 RepID=UPI003C6EA1D6
MVEKFFFSDKKWQIPDERHRIILVSGPPSSGKTSLLFQFAYNSAMEEDHGTVIILCNSRRLHTNPPLLSLGVDPSSEIFSRIQMKYVDDDQEMNNYFAALHLHDVLPASIIIDDFADFFGERKRYNNNPRGRELAMAHALALCRNAIDHANTKGRCQLLLSDTHKGDSPRLLYIYKRWVACIYTIYAGGSGIFTLEKSYSQVAIAERMQKSANYSIAHQHLLLKGINRGVEH